MSGERSITAREIAEIFDYSPETGEIKCKATRPRSHFKDDRSFKYWHSVYPGKPVGKIDVHGYVRIRLRVLSKLHEFKGHRVAFACMTGRWPGSLLDHINTIKSDNRWANLRECDRSQNMMNRTAPTNNSTGFKNVYNTKVGYRASVTAGDVKHDKLFKDLNEAAAWAHQKREEMHGEFVRHAAQPAGSREKGRAIRDLANDIIDGALS